MKAAVFDVDGTLVDSISFWENLAKNYLISIKITPKDNLNKALEILTIEEGVLYMKEEYNIEKTPIEIRKEMDELMFSFYKKDVKLKPYVIEMIKFLNYKGIRLAIASVISEELILSVLDRYNIANYFEFIQTCENTNISKDDEEFFKVLIRRLNLKPNEIFLFEDSLYSMKSAKRVNLNVIAVEEKSSIKNLEEIVEVSDIYIKDFSKLINLLEL